MLIWYVFSAVHIILLPNQKPPSSYSLLKFVYVTSRLRNSLVGHPLPRKILNWPTYIFSKGLWLRLATIVHLANDLSCRYETWEIACELQNHIFVSSKYVFQGIMLNFSNNKNEPWKTVRLTRFQKPQLQTISIFFKFVHPSLFVLLNSFKIFSIFYVSLNLVTVLIGFSFFKS